MAFPAYYTIWHDPKKEHFGSITGKELAVAARDKWTSKLRSPKCGKSAGHPTIAARDEILSFVARRLAPRT